MRQSRIIERCSIATVSPVTTSVRKRRALRSTVSTWLARARMVRSGRTWSASSGRVRCRLRACRGRMRRPTTPWRRGWSWSWIVPARRRRIRVVLSFVVSIALNTRTRFSICWPSISTCRLWFRRTTRRLDSITTPIFWARRRHCSNGISSRPIGSARSPSARRSRLARIRTASDRIDRRTSTSKVFLSDRSGAWSSTTTSRSTPSITFRWRSTAPTSSRFAGSSIRIRSKSRSTARASSLPRSAARRKSPSRADRAAEV